MTIWNPPIREFLHNVGFLIFRHTNNRFGFQILQIRFLFSHLSEIISVFFSSFQNAMCQFVNIVPLVSLWKFHLEIIGAEESPYILRK